MTDSRHWVQGDIVQVPINTINPDADELYTVVKKVWITGYGIIRAEMENGMQCLSEPEKGGWRNLTILAQESDDRYKYQVRYIGDKGEKS